MKLILLGTAGYHPCDARQTACFAIPELGILLDAGTGIYRLSDYPSADRWDIFLTHAHLDHIIGLTYLFDTMPRDLLSKVTVHGESEKLDAVREFLFSKPLFPVVPPFQFQPLTGPIHLSSDAVVSYFPLQHHPGGSVGYRLDTPHGSLAYVTDTIASVDANYIEPIRGVDLLIHEAHFLTGEEAMIRLTGHSHVLAATEVARQAKVGRLLLVHLNPNIKDDSEIDIEQARSIFPATEIGVDRMEVDF